MQLKTYQQDALDQLDRWLDALKEQRRVSERSVQVLIEKGLPVPDGLKNWPAAAWKSLKERGQLPGIPKGDAAEVPDWVSRTTALGEPIPHVCLKVPTGGGKTLLGVAALERLSQGRGFVLWIVPTKAIYEQTVTAFRTREHPYRQMLERISGGRVKLLQKSDCFTKQDIASRLCIMLLMLPSANRQRGKEFLKIFRDSGGYTTLFPEQDDPTANRALAETYRDLEKNGAGEWVKQSLINTLKMIRPTVVLDEAHKAYGSNDTTNSEFVRSVNRLDPRFVLELSATPKIGISNMIISISGRDLQDEEMIKLPIEIRSFANSDWKRTLAETQRRLAELEGVAREQQERTGRYVRPIALVRVQRTGEGQRRRETIHAEDARDYLITNLAVPKEAIRIQSSEKRELAGEDLLSEASRVRWIITKDALKEGWDCSFAYILALLDTTRATTAMTQMVGRVMRQPHARRIETSEALNRCYIYCFNKDVGEAVESVKAGLEREGLTGLGDAVQGCAAGEVPKPLTIRRRSKYEEVDIVLPTVLHRTDAADHTRGDGEWRPIDHDRDILGAIDWDHLDAGKAPSKDDRESNQKNQSAVVYLQGYSALSEEAIAAEAGLTLDYFVRRLIDMLPNPWQAARIAEDFIQGTGSGNRIGLSEMLRERLRTAIDEEAEAIFRRKLTEGIIRFQPSYELERSVQVSVSNRERRLHGAQAKEIQQSLFEPLFESGFNTLEKDVALYLEDHDAIYWWHRIPARQGYFVQGWRRHRVYPDFIASIERSSRTGKRLLVLEVKGEHLVGNADTDYKRKLLRMLEEGMSIRKAPIQFRLLPQAGWRTALHEELEI